ncbi:hypothetical protein K458DRAFT_397054 [Lentithecium fluviatile CBS 122367]|uniref:Peptidase A2 domain-containing protein n=1 Tax=Lentithecium fluviatile CBS 122367 TaxID=1168545 RepID=A0A6G1IEC4_9PLEO|nr:hypothetical protein K458DRAFT_397054 [Lentithecium fluviatile CBS 122367]
MGDSMERWCDLKMTVNGELVDGFVDTGLSHNIVDEEWAKKQNLDIVKGVTDLTMGNRSKSRSPRYVEIDVGFAGEEYPAEKKVARVVKSFPFDLPPPKRFLEATRTLKELRRRFTKCLFPCPKCFFMNLLDDEADRQRFHGLFNDDIEFAAVLETGSNCNIMRQD